MALSAEDCEKVKSSLRSVLVNLSRKYPSVTAEELKVLLGEVVQELERKGFWKRQAVGKRP